MNFLDFHQKVKNFLDFHQKVKNFLDFDQKSARCRSRKCTVSIKSVGHSARVSKFVSNPGFMSNLLSKTEEKCQNPYSLSKTEEKCQNPYSL